MSPPHLITPFTGRAAEHQQLVSSYTTAKNGQPQLVVLTGEVGVGKTRLAEEFCHWATAQGADLLQGRAFESGGRLPYQPIAQALRNRLEAENAPDDLLADVWLAELSLLLPELRERYPDLPNVHEEATTSSRLFEAVTRLVEALATRGPLLCFLADLQWLDRASLDLLHYALLRWQTTATPLLTLLTVRWEELATSSLLQNWLADLARQMTVTRLNLDTLSFAETNQLVAALVQVEQGDGEDHHQRAATLQEFQQWLFRETKGQPLYLSELLKLLSERQILRPQPQTRRWQLDLPALQALRSAQNRQQQMLPSSVRDLIQSRLARLDEAALALLTATAVLGRAATFTCLCQTANVAEAQALTTLDDLLRSRLLIEASDRQQALGAEPIYLITHDQIRHVVYEMAGEARRRVFHRRAVEALTHNAPAPADLAHHALRGGLHEAAFRHYLAAGDEALRLFAIRDAIGHYQTAQLVSTQHFTERLRQSITLAEWQRLHTQWGRACELTDDWRQARTLYEHLLQLARTAGNPVVECQALNRLATVFTHGLIDLPHAAALLQEA